MIAVIDVSGNNLKSLTHAISSLGFSYQLTHNPEDLFRASHVILPGVGAADPAMKALKKWGLQEVLQQITQPILGICLGMQLLLEHSEECNVDCLNLLPGSARKLPAKKQQPVPHMGWSKLNWLAATSLNNHLSAEDYFYFVHSFALLEAENAVATCEYSETFTAIVQYQNIVGMQFHPEKSAATGLNLLNNFLQAEEK